MVDASSSLLGLLFLLWIWSSMAWRSSCVLLKGFMVLQEEQPKCGNGSNGGGRKKNKQKKIPQRGLGVAQLEKLRMEEQQKNNAPPSFSNASQGTIPFPSHLPILPFLTVTNDPNPVLRPAVDHHPLFRHSESISTPDNCFSTTLPQLLENPVVGSGNAGHGFLSLLWNSLEPSPINAEAPATSFGFRTPPNGDTSIPGWPPSGLQQSRQRQELSPTSVANKVLPPSSSGVSLQMEPPSNQSYTSSYTVSSSWPEEERAVGMKRPWPFHLEGMPGQTPFPCKLTSFSSSYLKPNESMPDFIKSEPKRTYFRPVDLDSSDEENGAIDGGFRSLGPPSAPSTPKPKQPPLTRPSCSVDYPEFSSVPCQGGTSDAVSSSRPPPFYSFLPMGPNGCEKTLNERRREALDGVDLSLKL